jgi:methylmalonyl-CoA/ethylmalonyl-CoA epimerase
VTTEAIEGLNFKLRHVGVAVPSLGPATDVLESLFGYRVISGPFDDPIQKVTVNFLTQSDNDVAEIELIAPLTDDSPIKSMLSKGSGGAYHLCFETSDIEKALAHAKSKGCMVVSAPAPAVAFGGRRIAWIYTQTRQLFELVESEVATSAQEV